MTKFIMSALTVVFLTAGLAPPAEAGRFKCTRFAQTCRLPELAADVAAQCNRGDTPCSRDVVKDQRKTNAISKACATQAGKALKRAVRNTSRVVCVVDQKCGLSAASRGCPAGALNGSAGGAFLNCFEACAYATAPPTTSTTTAPTSTTTTTLPVPPDACVVGGVSMLLPSDPDKPHRPVTNRMVDFPELPEGLGVRLEAHSHPVILVALDDDGGGPFATTGHSCALRCQTGVCEYQAEQCPTLAALRVGRLTIGGRVPTVICARDLPGGIPIPLGKVRDGIPNIADDLNPDIHITLPSFLFSDLLGSFLDVIFRPLAWFISRDVDFSYADAAYTVGDDPHQDVLRVRTSYRIRPCKIFCGKHRLTITVWLEPEVIDGELFFTKVRDSVDWSGNLNALPRQVRDELKKKNIGQDIIDGIVAAMSEEGIANPLALLYATKRITFLPVDPSPVVADIPNAEWVIWLQP